MTVSKAKVIVQVFWSVAKWVIDTLPTLTWSRASVFHWPCLRSRQDNMAANRPWREDWIKPLNKSLSKWNRCHWHTCSGLLYLHESSAAAAGECVIILLLLYIKLQQTCPSIALFPVNISLNWSPAAALKLSELKQTLCIEKRQTADTTDIKGQSNPHYSA